MEDEMISNNLVPVFPLSNPTGLIFYVDFNDYSGYRMFIRDWNINNIINLDEYTVLDVEVTQIIFDKYQIWKLNNIT